MALTTIDSSAQRFARAPVTDLSPLAALTALRTLYLHGTPATAAAVEQLQFTLPRLHLVR